MNPKRMLGGKSDDEEDVAKDIEDEGHGGEGETSGGIGASDAILRIPVLLHHPARVSLSRRRQWDADA